MLDGILLFTTAGTAAAAITNILGVSVYDARKRPVPAPRRQRPFVTVIIYTHDNALEIEQTLKSVAKSSYRKLQIIIADNCSVDDTRQIVRSFIAAKPKKNIKLYAKRAATSKQALLMNAFRLHAKGEIILLLEAGATVEKDSVKRATAYFDPKKPISILNANYRIKSAPNVANILQDYGVLVRSRLQKTADVFNADYFADHRGGVFYSAAALAGMKTGDVLSPVLLRNGDKTLRVGYAEDVIISGSSPDLSSFVRQFLSRNLARLIVLAKAAPLLVNKQNPRHTLRLVWVYYPAAIIFFVTSLVWPLVLAYFTYLAIAVRQPDFLLICWAAAALYTIFTVLESNNLKLRQKLRYIFLMPLNYTWLYVLALLQYGSLLAPVFRVLTSRRSGENAAL